MPSARTWARNLLKLIASPFSCSLIKKHSVSASSREAKFLGAPDEKDEDMVVVSLFQFVCSRRRDVRHFFYGLVRRKPRRRREVQFHCRVCSKGVRIKIMGTVRPPHSAAERKRAAKRRETRSSPTHAPFHYLNSFNNIN
jgi:hypothetical protein